MSGQDYEQLTLFQEDSPVSHLVLPGSDEARRMTVTSGLRCYELCKISGPLGLLAKMLLGSSIWHSTRCYLTWKVSATPSRRLLFRLVPSTPHTGETDVPLLPTITRFDADCGDLKGKEYTGTHHAMKLIQAVKMWPTPKAQNSRGNGEKHGDGGPSLDVVVGGQMNPDWVEWLMAFPPGWTDIG